MASEVRRAAEEYIGKGYSVVALRPKSKKPIHDDWPNLSITADNVGGYFSNGENLGVKTGAPSGNRVDVDLDVPEALAIAGRFLEPTLTSGRESAAQPLVVRVARYRDDRLQGLLRRLKGRDARRAAG